VVKPETSTTALLADAAGEGEKRQEAADGPP
jgi:hypothetical protein